MLLLTMVSTLLPFSAAAFSDQGTAKKVTEQANSTGIVELATDIKPLLPGMMVPNTCLETASKQSVCTEALFKDKPTVLIVYRGGWCPYCSAQLSRLQKIDKAIKFLGYQMVAVSPDSNKNIDEQQSNGDITYKLLADPKLELAKALGLAFFLDKKTEAMYRDRLGVPFIDIQGESRVALPVPAVYIIDQQGLVHFQYVNPNYDVRISEGLLYTAASETMKAINEDKRKAAITK